MNQDGRRESKQRHTAERTADHIANFHAVACEHLAVAVAPARILVAVPTTLQVYGSAVGIDLERSSEGSIHCWFRFQEIALRCAVDFSLRTHGKTLDSLQSSLSPPPSLHCKISTPATMMAVTVVTESPLSIADDARCDVSVEPSATAARSHPRSTGADVVCVMMMLVEW